MKVATSLLLFSVLALLMLGIVMLVSASTGQPQAKYLIMQPIWAGVGLVALLVAASGDYRWLKRLWWAPLLIAVGALVLVLMSQVGLERNGARRWLGVGRFTLQPSEFAKVALIIALAWYGEYYQRFMGRFWRGVVYPGLGIAVVLALIFKEPDVGTTMLLACVSCMMLLLSGIRWRYIAPPVMLAVTALAIFIVHDPVRSARFYSWLHIEETKLDKGHQTYQAIAALGSGGVWGVGLGEGRQKLGFVPEHHTDFIFSVIGEELGLIATLSVLVAFFMIILCAVYVAWNAADTFGMLIAAGIACLIALQVIINVGVVTGSLPNKGLALPFISYGGSNLVVMMGCVGLLINIGRQAAHHVPMPVLSGDADELTAPGTA